MWLHPQTKKVKERWAEVEQQELPFKVSKAFDETFAT